MSRIIKYAVATLLLLLAVGPAVSSQTISPVIQTCVVKKKDAVCAGSFNVRNNQVIPLYVVLEKKSITGNKGTLKTVDLDSKSVELNTNKMSARISPQATESFEYKLRCLTYPCAAQIVSTMVVGHTTDEVQIKLSLPELIVACDSGKPQECRNTFRRAYGLPDNK